MLDNLGIMSTGDSGDAKKMWANQWAKGNMLNDTALCINFACQPVTSVKNLDMSFMTMPEITQSGCDVNFTMEDGLELFDQDIGTTSIPNQKTFLAAENYFAF
jgi:hypothetical protein